MCLYSQSTQDQASYVYKWISIGCVADCSERKTAEWLVKNVQHSEGHCLVLAELQILL